MKYETSADMVDVMHKSIEHLDADLADYTEIVNRLKAIGMRRTGDLNVGDPKDRTLVFETLEVIGGRIEALKFVRMEAKSLLEHIQKDDGRDTPPPNLTWKKHEI